MRQSNNTTNNSLEDVSLDLESPQTIPDPPRRVTRPRTGLQRYHTRTARMINSEVRETLARTIVGEVDGMVHWRDRWKRFGDACEAIAKGLSGVGAILAFAASSVRDTQKADILSFTSGTVGTVGLVLLAYSSYAIKESRQRTAELNTILDSLGVTPLPEITTHDPPGDS